jgi:hypothetical protein
LHISFATSKPLNTRDKKEVPKFLDFYNGNSSSCHSHVVMPSVRLHETKDKNHKSGVGAMAEPQWAAVMKDVVTSAALVLGGGWAAWKWGYGETLRRRREMPSPDGTLTAAGVRLNDTTTAVTITAIWRNRGPLPIELCATHTAVDAFRLKHSLPAGLLF